MRPSGGPGGLPLGPAEGDSGLCPPGTPEGVPPEGAEGGSWMTIKRLLRVWNIGLRKYSRERLGYL